ncbi:unnamed protein product [Lota lota]
MKTLEINPDVADKGEEAIGDVEGYEPKGEALREDMIIICSGGDFPRHANTVVKECRYHHRFTERSYRVMMSLSRFIYFAFCKMAKSPGKRTLGRSKKLFSGDSKTSCFSGSR